MVSQAELILRVITGSWSYLNFFRDGMGPFKTTGATSCDTAVFCTQPRLKLIFKVAFSEFGLSQT